jgi:hypothetical protein
MHLTLSPSVGLPGEPETTIHVAGDVITIDGTPYDLSPVPEGGEATAEDSPFVGRITRAADVIHCTVLVRIGDTAAPDQGADPWVIENAEGDVEIPAIRKPVIEEPEPEGVIE